MGSGDGDVDELVDLSIEALQEKSEGAALVKGQEQTIRGRYWGTLVLRVQNA
jgi:hypothetical protein